MEPYVVGTMAGSFCLLSKLDNLEGNVLVAKDLREEVSRSCNDDVEERDDRGARLEIADTIDEDREFILEKSVEDIGIGAIARDGSLVARRRRDCFASCDANECARCVCLSFWVRLSGPSLKLMMLR